MRILAFGKTNEPPNDGNSVRVEKSPLPPKQKGAFGPRARRSVSQKRMGFASVVLCLTWTFANKYDLIWTVTFSANLIDDFGIC
jgi:hypothetical protein